jgi:hypothetical protein
MVRLADGSGVEAIGYGDVSIRTTICTVLLHNVWYTPELACRLISTAMLNNKGVSVLLENCKLKAFKNQGLLFEGTAKGGLYYVDQPEEHVFKADSTPPEPYSHDKRALWHA